MHPLRGGLRTGLLAGAVGLLVMEVVRRLTAPLVRAPAPTPDDVFITERSMSLIGVHHDRDESATEALGRLAYRKLAGRDPSNELKQALSWGIHIGYGVFVASLYGAIRRGHGGDLRDGLWLGTGLWLLGDELAVPLLGLADNPTAYHPTRHLQALAQHLGFGIATAATTDFLEGFR